MKYEEAKNLAASLAGMFPNQITTQQAAFAVKTFQGLNRVAVQSAIAEHRKSRQAIDWPALFAACDPVESPCGTGDEGSPPDIYRRQNRSWAGRSDAEVILRKYRSDFHCSGGSAGYREKFFRDCVYALVQYAQVQPTDAEAWANLIFEDVPTFGLALEDLRGNLPGGRAA